MANHSAGAEAKRVLCVDLGGSRVKLAAVENGRVLASGMFDTLPETGATLAEAAERGREVVRSAGGGFAGVALAAPGIVDETARRVVVCNGKYAGLESVDLVAWSQREFGLDAKIVNDARAALMGELAFGCAKGETDAVIAILGTGVGVSAVSGGRIIRGKHFVHGLLGGHIPVNFDGGRRCTCGGMNCVEAYAGTWALKEMAGDPSYDFRRLERDWAAGDPKAARLFDTISRALGAGVLALVNAFDPETVIWSGGTSRFGALVRAAQDYVLENAWTPWGTLKFVKSADPEASVTLGLGTLFGGPEF